MNRSPAKTILIVVHDPVLNRTYSHMLRERGHRVVSAHNTAEAINATNETHPNTILLDVDSPAENGVDFLEAYQAPTKHPDVAIYVLTDNDDAQTITRAYKLGVQRYLLRTWTSSTELLKMLEEGHTDS